MRKIHFSYGHRLMGTPSKCSTLHGHNGVVEIHACPIAGLDDKGMIIDFCILKEKIGAWVEKHWDHTMLLCAEDTETIPLVSKCPSYKEPFILEYNPTAENMAHYLLWEVAPKLLAGSGVIVHKIVLWETNNCSATQSLDPTSKEALKLYGL